MTTSKMRLSTRHVILIAAVVTTALCLFSYAGAVSGGGKVAREIAEELAEQAGKKASREVIETTSLQLEKIASKCGNQSLDVIEKNGLVAFRVFESAGDDAGPYLVNAIRAYGDDAIRVAQTTAGRTILRNGSETAIRAVSRHSDAAIPLIRQYGDDCAHALTQLTPGNGRRLIQIVDEKLLPSDNIQELLEPIGKYGDRAMDFIWRNRKALTSITLVAAFISNPEPYLNGSAKLAQVAISPVVEIGGTIVKSINWNLWVGVMIMLVGLRFLFKRRLRLQNAAAGKEPKS